MRALLGALVAGVVAAYARRAGALTAGGQWAAFVTGSVVAAAGWSWAALLIAYFVLSSVLTRTGRERKRALTESTLPSHHERNALQVVANGGLFAAVVLLGELRGDPALLVAGLGALTAAAADTWATEVGLLWGGEPRSILTGRLMPRGVSGGITLVGVGASIGAAALFAGVGAALLGERPRGTVVAAVFLAGVAGSVADSLLGATLQSKRWCDQCRTWTERRVHTCKYRTQHARGIRWMTNDTVNFLATAVGALVALASLGSLD